MKPQNCPLHNAAHHISGFFIEPYRPFFALGVIYNVIVMGLWFTWLHGLQMQRVFLPFQISPLQAHFHWMMFGFPSLYIFGFLLTAFPKWVNAHPTKGPYNIFLALMLFLSQILILLGTLFSVSLLKFTLLFELLMMLVLFKLLFNFYISYSGKKLFDQSSMVLIALTFGIIAQIFYQLSIWKSFTPYYSLSLYFAQYPYLLFLMMGVSYRILAFFTSTLPPSTEVSRGPFTLHFAFALIVLLGTFKYLSFLKPFSYLQGLILIFLGLIWLKELQQWKWKKSLSNFLLYSHYLAFFWAVLFLEIKGIQEFFPHSFFQDQRIYLALQHMFFVGSISTLIWGISTRVTRGHGGLGFALGKIDYFIFGLLQLAVLTRVIIPFLEVKFPVFQGQSLHAAFLWWLAFLFWGIRYLPVLSRSPGTAKNKS